MAANDDAKQEQGHGDAAQGGKKIAMIIANKSKGKSDAETALAPKTTTFLLLIFICFSTLIPYSFNVCRYAKTSSTC